ARTFSGHGAFWLNPKFYAYSDGIIATTHTDSGTDTTVFRATGGFGFQPNKMWSAAVYYGRQGSETQGSGSAGGDVFGGNVTYKPTPKWTVKLTVDETINIASRAAPSSNLALFLPVQSPLLIPLSSSTRVTSTSLQADYLI